MLWCSCPQAQIPVLGGTETISNPVLSPDGQTLFFSRHKCTGNLGLDDHQDIWYCDRTGNTWSKPIHFPLPVNSFGHDSPVMVGLGNATTWVVQNDQLRRLERSGRRWQYQDHFSAIKLPDSISKVHDWSISLDERTLVFCGSVKPDGPADIYLKRRQASGPWNQAVRLPFPVNTRAHEGSVFLSADGRTLYFSSDRPGGLGGQDLFVSHITGLSGSSWSEPVNLGHTINSPGNDKNICIASAGQITILESDRKGSTQIFEAELPDSLSPLPASLITCRIPSDFSLKGVSINYFPAHNPRSITSVPFQFQTYHTEILLTIGNTYGFFLEHPYRAFSDSKLLDLTPNGYEPVDVPFSDEANTLAKHHNYQEREKIIRNLQEEIFKINQAIQSLNSQFDRQKLQLSQITYPKESDQISNRFERSNNDLRKNYDRHRKEAEIKKQNPFSYSAPFTIPLRPPAMDTLGSEPISPQERIDQLRDLYILRRENGYVPFNPLSMDLLDSLQSIDNPLVSFDDFQKHMLVRIQAKAFPEILEELIQRGVATSLQEMEGQIPENERAILNRDRSALEKWLKEKVFVVAEPDSSNLPPMAYWQYETAAAISNRLRNGVRQNIRSLLAKPIAQVYQSELALYLKQERKIILESALDEQIDEQLSIEGTVSRTQRNIQSLGATLSRDTLPSEELISIPLSAPDRMFHLDALLFRANSPAFLPVAIADLDRIIRFLNQNPDLGVFLGVHTHTKLSHSYATRLSNDRAIALRRYLEDSGIAPHRITTRGFGKREPIDFSGTPEGHLENQRVEATFFIHSSTEEKVEG